MSDEKRIDDLRVRVDIQAVLAQLRMQPDSPAGPRVTVLVERVEQTVRPKALYRACQVTSSDAGRVKINGVEFHSRTLAALLQSIDQVFVYVVTCGPEASAPLPANRGAFERLAHDAISNQMLRQSCHEFERRIAQQYHLEGTATLGPGAGDGVLWPIEDQRALFSLLGDTETSIGVSLTDDHMMLPMKSLSGVLFATDNGFRSCQLCTSHGCGMRDAPFDSRVWQALANGSARPLSS